MGAGRVGVEDVTDAVVVAVGAVRVSLAGGRHVGAGRGPAVAGLHLVHVGLAVPVVVAVPRLLHGKAGSVKVGGVQALRPARVVPFQDGAVPVAVQVGAAGAGERGQQVVEVGGTVRHDQDTQNRQGLKG